MHTCKYATVFILLSMAVVLTNAEEKIVKPDPCAIRTCEPPTSTCVVSTRDCNPGEMPCAKCIKCDNLECQGGCFIREHDERCPTCECEKHVFGAKEKY